MKEQCSRCLLANKLTCNIIFLTNCGFSIKFCLSVNNWFEIVTSMIPTDKEIVLESVEFESNLLHLCSKSAFVLNFMNDFLSDCPSLMHCIAIHYAQHCQAMLECGLCEFAYFFFHSKCSQALKTCSLKLGF